MRIFPVKIVSRCTSWISITPGVPPSKNTKTSAVRAPHVQNVYSQCTLKWLTILVRFFKYFLIISVNLAKHKFCYFCSFQNRNPQKSNLSFWWLYIILVCTDCISGFEQCEKRIRNCLRYVTERVVTGIPIWVCHTRWLISQRPHEGREFRK